MADRLKIKIHRRALICTHTEAEIPDDLQNKIQQLIDAIEWINDNSSLLPIKLYLSGSLSEVLAIPDKHIGGD